MSFNFSHFLGRGAARRLDDNTPEQPEEDPNEPQGKTRSRRVEEPDNPEEDPNAEDPDDPEDPGKQGKKGKKAKARARRAEKNPDDPDEPDAEGDDDDGDDMVDDPADKEARMDERHRCARIFSSPHAAANPALAASLAFNTGMSSAAAIKVMTSTGMAPQQDAASRRPNLDQRMREENTPRLKHDSKEGAGGVVSLVALCNQLKGRG
ncbi:hypothetical protein [Serratia fonticola]|uniref:hypothetical protein n=1 Tax=Serratia fonticola TaxID=47917 RepID=UPI00301C6540